MIGDIISFSSINRFGMVAGTIIIDSNTFYQIYPISSAIYLSCDRDFICESNNSKELIMLETWNSVLVPKQTLEIVDTICEKYLLLYKKMYSFTLNSTINNDRHLISGPPISNNKDIRLLFQASEKHSFEPIKKLLITTSTLL